jgi:hypothetical protein
MQDGRLLSGRTQGIAAPASEALLPRTYPFWSTSRSAQIKAVRVPDLDVLLPYERQPWLVISLSCIARPGAGDQDLPHILVD